MPIYFTDRRFGLRVAAKEDIGLRVLPESNVGTGIRAVDKEDSEPSLLHFCGTSSESPLMCAEDLENSLMLRQTKE